MEKTFLKIGHRGNGAGYGENTLDGIHHAYLAGANCCEYDVRMTRDRITVLMHDPNINRTTNGTGRVRDYTYDELEKFNAGYGDTIPTLENVFRHFDYRFHNIELKEPIGKEVLELIIKYALEDRVFISSFNWDDLSIFRGTTIPTALLVDKEKINALGHVRLVEEAVSRGVFAINPHYLALTPSLISLAHQKDIRIYPWTVNKPKTVALLKSWGVDGIISDFPERL